MDDLKPDKKYRVQVVTSFEGTFREFIDDNGIKLAVFEQPWVGGRDLNPMRRTVPKSNIVSAELTKE